MLTLEKPRVWHDCHIHTLASATPFVAALEHAVHAIRSHHENPLMMGVSVLDATSGTIFAGWMAEEIHSTLRIAGVHVSFGQKARAAQLFPAFGVVLKLPVVILRSNDRWVGTWAAHVGDMPKVMRKPALLRELAIRACAKAIRNSRYFRDVAVEDIAAHIKESEILSLEGEGLVLIYRIPPKG